MSLARDQVMVAVNQIWKIFDVQESLNIQLSEYH